MFNILYKLLLRELNDIEYYCVVSVVISRTKRKKKLS